MAPSLALDPLPYHHAVVDYLQTEERALWDWFASGQARADYTESLRLALLKSTLTIYQAQQSGSGLNASLYFMPAEAHLVLTGPRLALLRPARVRRRGCARDRRGRAERARRWDDHLGLILTDPSGR